MREFIYYSKNAVTTGNFDLDNLMKAGRMDIACNIVIMSFFVSHHKREDVKLHLVFDGPPNAPVHIVMDPSKKELGDIKNKVDISKKDVAGLIRKILYKAPRKVGETPVEVFPGYTIEKKSLINVLNEIIDEGKEIYLLDKGGKDLRDIKLTGKEVFVIGDQDGIPKKEIKNLKKMEVQGISVGPYMYFASQVVTLIQNEIDRKLG